MRALNIFSKQKLSLILLCVLTVTLNPALAKSDMAIMADVQKAREMSRKEGDHSKHYKHVKIDKSQQYRGVYYGYLPCDFCAGIKMTLSLKNKKNYLLVTQYAQSSNREYFEKGKYEWDAKSDTVTLTPRKDEKIRKLRIKDEGSLIVLSPEGKLMEGNQDKYMLLRTDKNKSRDLHIH